MAIHGTLEVRPTSRAESSVQLVVGTKALVKSCHFVPLLR
jgi:hypothetical protein